VTEMPVCLPVIVPLPVSVAVIDCVPAVPAVIGEGKPLTARVLAAAGLTVIPVCAPATEPLCVSVAVIDWVPAVLRVTVKGHGHQWLELFQAAEAGRITGGHGGSRRREPGSSPLTRNGRRPGGSRRAATGRSANGRPGVPPEGADGARISLGARPVRRPALAVRVASATLGWCDRTHMRGPAVA
jgi:hypothetical protein